MTDETRGLTGIIFNEYVNHMHAHTLRPRLDSRTAVRNPVAKRTTSRPKLKERETDRDISTRPKAVVALVLVIILQERLVNRSAVLMHSLRFK